MGASAFGLPKQALPTLISQRKEVEGITVTGIFTTGLWTRDLSCSYRRFQMIRHLIHHLYKSTHYAVKHSSSAANAVFKPIARVTPMAWLQSGKAHKHTTS